MRHILAHEVPDEMLLECRMTMSEESYRNTFEPTAWHVVVMFVETFVHASGYLPPTSYRKEQPFFEFSKKHYVPLAFFNKKNHLFLLGEQSHIEVSDDIYEKLVVYDRRLLLMREAGMVRFSYI